MTALHTSLPPDALAAYVGDQVAAFFPDGGLDRGALATALEDALERIEHCFSHVHLKYYQDDAGRPTYDHLHTDQHAALLCLLAGVLFRSNADPRLAAKVYALNKTLHGLDVFYEVELPPVFYFQHPLGTVLGRARFGNYLAVYQGVTVGADLEGRYPTFGDGVVLFGGSRVIGQASLGDNTWVAPAAIVMDQVFPADSILFGGPVDTQRKVARRHVQRDFFGHGDGSGQGEETAR